MFVARDARGELVNVLEDSLRSKHTPAQLVEVSSVCVKVQVYEPILHINL